MMKDQLRKLNIILLCAYLHSAMILEAKTHVNWSKMM